MKRILLSLILISSAFACNAMSDKEKFDSLKEACKCPNVSVKKVNTLLTNNTYVSNNPKKLLRLALKIYKVM